MKLILYEFKKLFGARYLLIFALLLLILNSLFIVFESNEVAERIPTDAAEDFIELYREDPDTVMADYEDRQAAWEEIYKLENEMFLSGLSYDYEPPESKYAKSEDYTDDELYMILNNLLYKTYGYRDTASDVIGRAYDNLAEFDRLGLSKTEYSYRYQLRVIELYEKARDNVRFGLEYVRGWNEYFGYGAVNIFITVVLIMAGTVIFSQEKVSGFLPIMRTAKNGRLRTAVGKLTAMIAVAVLTVLIFTASTLLTYWVCFGFSSPMNAIQILDAYSLSPYVLTISEYLMLTVAVKIVIFVFFSAVVVTASVFTYNYVITYIAGLGFYGINFLLNSMRFVGVDGAFGALNLVAAANVTPLTDRYRAVNFFGHTADYVPFMFALYTILTLIFFSLSVFRYIRSGEGKSWRFVAVLSQYVTQKITTLKANASKRKKERSHPHSIFLYEMFKLLLSSRLWILILLLLFAKIYVTVNEYSDTESYSDAVYKSYMTELEGEITEEKRQYIISEREMISETLAVEFEMQSAYFGGAISVKEYFDYLDKLSYAKGRDEVLMRIEDHVNYIDEKASLGPEAWFLYDTGWREIFFSSFDPTMYALILAVFSGIFASEYDSRSSADSFSQILRMTKHGRKKTFVCKFLSVIIVSVIISVVWAVSDILIISGAYELPAINAPLLSIQQFGSLNTNMSVCGYLFFMYVVRTFAIVLLAFFTCSLSLLFGKSLLTISTVAAVTLLPSILSYFGVNVMSLFDYISFMLVTPIVTESILRFVVFAILCTVTVSVLMLSGRRKWCY